MRKHAAWYLKGIRGNGKVRNAINECQTRDDLVTLLNALVIEIEDMEQSQIQDEAFEYARRAAKEEGILGGISSGAAIFAALKIAKELGKGRKVLAILPSNGERYLSTPLY